MKASHILLSGEGRVYLSGLHSVYSMMREGKRMRAVFDMPHHSPALLPWLSPELLRQVRSRPLERELPEQPTNLGSPFLSLLSGMAAAGLSRTCMVTESSRTSTVSELSPASW